MIKLSIKFDLSLGKLQLGFAGIFVAVCTYKFYSTKQYEESPNSDSDDIISINPKQNYFENKEIDDLVSTLRSKKTVSSDKDSNEERLQLKTSPKKLTIKSLTKNSESVNLSL